MLELFATGEVIMNQRKHSDRFVGQKPVLYLLNQHSIMPASDRVEGDKGNLKVKTYKNLVSWLIQWPQFGCS